MSKTIDFSSILAPYINGLIKEKRSLGYDYRTEELILLRFDNHCLEHGLETISVTKPFLSDWCEQTKTEGVSNHNKRVTAVRQLMLFMASMGVHVYLPKCMSREDVVLPHIFTVKERNAFFNEVDNYRPLYPIPAYIRLSCEYRVLFRLIYCCGLRNTEACGVPADCMDLETGAITIYDSKGNKDRTVYMSDDLTELCKKYFAYLRDELGCHPTWFFPGRDPSKPLVNSSVNRVFNKFWFMTPNSEHCNNKPTVHDLRFSFVTDRINEWALQGIDLNVMMPYLSCYLGHKGLQETYYYYHNSKQLHEVIRTNDKTSGKVIPEVVDYE